MANHAVVRTDKMYGTDVRSGLVSIKYIVTSTEGEGSSAVTTKTPTEIENGNVLKVGALMDGEREIYEGSAPSASDTIDNIVLIATPEMMYDERLKNLDDFINPADKPCRGYILHHKDIFSVTAEALDSLTDTEQSPAVGKGIAIMAGTKLKVVSSGTTIGKIIAKDVVGRYTYYVIEIN